MEAQQKPFTIPSIILSLILITTSISYSQEEKPLPIHHETVDNSQPNMKKSYRKTSEAFYYKSDIIFVTQVNVDNSGLNIELDAANEPSIALDYTKPNNIAIGWRQFDNVNSNFRQAGFAYTTDGGHKWTFPGVIELGVFRSDPVLDSDAEGNFYYNSLTHDENDEQICDVFKSTDGGVTWNNGVYALGGDKQWMTIDKVSDIGKGNIYAFWTSVFSICAPNSFTRSVDGGQSFEPCLSIPHKPYYGTLDVAKNGDLYIGGFAGDRFVVVKSTTAKYPDSSVTFNEPSIVDLGGLLTRNYSPPINGIGLTGQTYIAVDTSNGTYKDYVYLLASIAKNNGDPADVMIAASSDGGETWLPPVRVNDDTSSTAWQWFATMSVAPNGRIDVVWLDTRNDSLGRYYCELYYSFSYDGGQTWYPNVNLLEKSFLPYIGWPQQNKMGDYYDMVSDNDGVYLAWAATFNDEQDIYYARIFTDEISSVEEKSNEIPAIFRLEQNYPNPFNPSTTIKFSIINTQFSTLKVYDALGREVETLINKNLQPGTYEVSFDASNLSNGVYFYTLTSGSFVQTKKMILLK